jgi:hypothetical protein
MIRTAVYEEKTHKMVIPRTSIFNGEVSLPIEEKPDTLELVDDMPYIVKVNKTEEGMSCNVISKIGL